MYAGVDNYSADRRFAEAELSYYMYVMFLTICHPPPLTQGRHWFVPLNEVCTHSYRLPCVRGAVSKAD